MINILVEHVIDVPSKMKKLFTAENAYMIYAIYAIKLLKKPLLWRDKFVKNSILLNGHPIYVLKYRKSLEFANLDVKNVEKVSLAEELILVIVVSIIFVYNV